MFAAVVMGYLERIFGGEILNDADIAARAGELRRTITEGIEAHAKTTKPQWRRSTHSRPTAWATSISWTTAMCPPFDGGPILGYCAPDDPDISGNRRAAQRRKPVILRGEYLKGHRLTAPRRAMAPIARLSRAMTSDNKDFKAHILDRLVATSDAGTHLMHEGIDVNDPTKYTRGMVQLVEYDVLRTGHGLFRHSRETLKTCPLNAHCAPTACSR